MFIADKSGVGARRENGFFGRQFAERTKRRQSEGSSTDKICRQKYFDDVAENRCWKIYGILEAFDRRNIVRKTQKWKFVEDLRFEKV